MGDAFLSSTLGVLWGHHLGVWGAASTPTGSGVIVWSGERGLGLEEPVLSERKWPRLEARSWQRLRGAVGDGCAPFQVVNDAV